MRLEEIQSDAAGEAHVRQLKVGARRAKERARQVQAQADDSADKLSIRQARQDAAGTRGALKPIKPVS